MATFLPLIFEVITWLFLIYGVAVFLIYGWIGIYAMGAVSRYKKENTFTDYSMIAANPNAPTFTIIAPAYNEGMTIVDNVRSLLSLYYHRLEIIIVNDGSKDDSMQKLIQEYELEAVSFYIQGKIETNKVRGVYRSKNPAFKKLTVVDKENGGKADALNVGVNVSCGDYLVCIDVDCILEQDAILKLAKPFLEQTDKKLIACGGVIRLANNCTIENGKVTEVNLPKSLLGRTQALEYIRAFVLGRMAWSRASGLILISGAFGVFDREIVLACGGYDRKTVGEDMELVVRMRKYMEEKKEPYEVITIPDPLCWTEVPESKDILRKQRNRWMRGTMETLWKHRKMMLNPKYGKLGMVSLPYWLLFEFLGPLVEFLGYLFFILFVILGIINWQFFLILFALVISTGFLFSIYAMLVDLLSHQVYVKRRDFLTLIATAVLEPFYFHPIVVKASVRGFIDYFKKSHAWGEMTRQGFNATDSAIPFWKRLGILSRQALEKWGVLASVLMGVFLIGVTAEWAWYRYLFPDFDSESLAALLFWNNGILILQLLSAFGLVYLILNLWQQRFAQLFAITGISLLIILQFILLIYFAESHNLLGADAFYYSFVEMKQILAASGMLSVQNILVVMVALSGILWGMHKVSLHKFRSPFIGLLLTAIGIPFLLIPSAWLSLTTHSSASDFEQTAGTSKLKYFLESNLEDFYSQHPEITAFFEEQEDTDISSEIINNDYPFWRKETTPDVLGPYLEKAPTTPNLVLVIVEGLGHSYSDPNGYVGSFTPFLNELQTKSLSWENALTSSGRTFSAIPTLTGSLPFGQKGFLDIEKTPDHFNLFTILKKNGFETGFFYGGNSEFDNLKPYLEYSKVNQINDEYTFDNTYRKLPENNGESWGFEDQAVFRKALKESSPNKPYFNTILTLSSHNSFKINDVSYFEKKYHEKINDGTLNSDQKKWAVGNKPQLVSIINADDALRGFFEAYKKRADFNHTIFIITGDHSMPEIALQNKIDRYHVPLLIYSSLLKSPKKFSGTVSHFDVAPSVLAFYRENYQLKTPSDIAWIGHGLRDKPGPATVGIPIMQSKNQLIDYVQGNYHLSGKQLYRLEQLQESAVDQEAMLKKLEKSFNQFKKGNATFYKTQRLLPDSVFKKFHSEKTDVR